MGAAFGPQMILMLLWKRNSYAGCLGGMLTGFAVAVLWKLVLDNTVTFGGVKIEVYNLPLAFAAAFMVNVFLSILLPDKASHEPDVLRQ